MHQYLLTYTKFVSEGIVQGSLYDLGAYPGFVHSDRPDDYVHGHIYAIQNEELLAVLDEYEGIGAPYEKPYEYERQMILVNAASGTVSCWVYIYNWSLDGQVVIPTGDYLKHLSST